MTLKAILFSSSYLFLISTFGNLLNAQVLPQYDGNVHMGVATCATSSCHGRVAPKKEGDLPQNEYRRWAHADFHAKTFNTLLGDEAKQIASKLGIGDPAKASLCLDCHTDNPAENYQGEKFSHEDGVGCESCHGGAQKWLSTHTAKNTPHEENLANGMYPTDEPVARAKLCLSCHLGDSNKIASHKIMGAGHPRLRFEMSAYNTNMTPHFVNSEWDVQRGKYTPDDIDLWFLGMLAAANNILSMWDVHLESGNWAPEISLFDCHSCHNNMDDLAWQPSNYRGVTAPGELRLNTSQIEVITSILLGAQLSSGQALHQSIKNIHGANGNVAQVKAAAASLSSALNQVEARYKETGLTNKQLENIRSKLISDAAQGDFNSFMLAEQAYLSIETIVIHLGEEDVFKKLLEAMLLTMTSESSFDAKGFQNAASIGLDI